MEIDMLAFGITAVSSVAAAGGAWGATRARIRRTEEDIVDLQDDATAHEKQDIAQHTQIVQRLSSIETLLREIDKRV